MGPRILEIFDTYNVNWSPWLTTGLKDSGNHQCLLAWKETILLIGGSLNKRGVQSFRLSSQTWTELDVSSAPMDVYFSGCAVLPDQTILVAGGSSAFPQSAALYNVNENTWMSVGELNFPRSGSSLVMLGSRIFAIGGSLRYRTSVEEFKSEYNRWGPVDQGLIWPRSHHSAIAVPAYMFTHLDSGCKGIN
jgi:hypothetical protein